MGVLPEDHPSLCFLWREEPAADVVGVFLAYTIFALQQIETDNHAMFPEAASAVLGKSIWMTL